jgi:hypothetical protein
MMPVLKLVDSFLTKHTHMLGDDGCGLEFVITTSTVFAWRNQSSDITQCDPLTIVADEASVFAYT